jgi:hypothetical protein
MNGHGGTLVCLRRRHTGASHETRGNHVYVVSAPHKAGGKSLGKLGGPIHVRAKSVTTDHYRERSVVALW